MLSVLWQDISYGTRLFIRRPAFSAIVIFTLALGIGVNAAIFSVARAFLWNPVPFHDLDNLVMLLEWAPQRSDYWNSVAPANYLDWKRQVTFLKESAAFGWQNLTLTGTTEPERVQGFRVSSNFFAVLGVEPAQGRAFLPEEEQPGHEHEVILSNGLWQRRFGSSPHINGSMVQLNGQRYTVVGVMPRDFNFPLTADVWVPLALDPAESNDRHTHELVVFGRLKSGISIRQARAEMEGLAQQLARAYPLTNKGWGVRTMSIREFVNGSLTRQFTLLLMGAVGFVLLIVCVNVTNLQLVLSTARRKEISIRMAIGAGKWRMVRQLVTESILLAVAGGLLSLVFAQVAIGMLLAHTSADMVRYVAGWEYIRLDGPAFVFILALALAAGIVSGAAPALSCRRAQLNQDLREGARASNGRTRRVRNAFVIAQVSLSLVLVAGASIMTKSFWTLSHLHHRFDPGTLLTMRVNLDGPQYHDPLRMQQFYDQVSQNLQTLPQVKSVAVATSVPFASNPQNIFFGAEGQPLAEDYFSAVLQSVSPSYFETLNVNLLQGRGFTDFDGPASSRVVIVSQNMAHRFWPEENPLGKRLRLGRANEDGPWRTIIGIVEGVQYDWTDPGPEMTIYLPYRQFPLPASFIVLRSAGAPAGLYRAVRNRVAAIDAYTPLFQMNTLDRLIADSVLGLGYVAGFVAVLGFIALVLAALGVYGIMAQTVNERMHEIGVRMALGAQPGDILRLILNQGVLLTAAGVILGAGMSLALARLLSGLLAGITPTEAITLFASCLLLVSISLFACYFPARRASHVDPKAVLHEQ